RFYFFQSHSGYARVSKMVSQPHDRVYQACLPVVAVIKGAFGLLSVFQISAPANDVVAVRVMQRGPVSDQIKLPLFQKRHRLGHVYVMEFISPTRLDIESENLDYLPWRCGGLH